MLREVAMKTTLSSICVFLILLYSTSNAASAQEPDIDPRDHSSTDTPVKVVDEPPKEMEIERTERTEGILLAQPPYTISYQGYLTDDLGNPLNGTYDMKFALFDAAVGGTREWGQEVHNGIEVRNGIFEATLGSVVTLYPNDFDEALWVKVWVNDEPLLPLQPVRAVPYAFGLVPGAEVQGDPVASLYALSVDNTGLDPNNYGLYAKGEKWGIYAEEVGADSDVGIFSPDFVHAKGYKATADTYWWFPGNEAVLYPGTDCTLWSQWHSSARLECSSSGYVDINIPISVPGVLFGQNVTVESVTVYYDLDHAGSYITRTDLRVLTVAGSSVSLISNLTDRTSLDPASYTLSATDNYNLSAGSGSLSLYLGIQHDGLSSHDVIIGAVRVRLGHQDQTE
jgi:hypothetical protein